MSTPNTPSVYVNRKISANNEETRLYIPSIPGVTLLVSTNYISYYLNR